MHKLVALEAAAVLACLMPVCSVTASYLEQNHQKQETPAPAETIPRRPSPPNEVCDLISRVRVGRPYSVKNLTVFPLRLDHPWGRLDYKTLDESLSRGYIEILEEKHPDVRTILVRNNSPHYVFLMGGEALGGGKQNRLISEDVLLAPYGRPVGIPVYCIEKGRWSEGRDEFRSSGFAAPSSMRRLAREGVGQRALWENVSGLLRETKTPSENEDLSAMYDNKAVAGEIASYRREIRMSIGDDVGCVVVVNGRIAGADVFSSPELFRKLWSKLIDSYAVDAIAHYERHGRWPGPPSEEEVRRFLDRVFRASFRQRDARDAGRIAEIAGQGIDGEGLVFQREVIHVHLTPRQEVRF